jgi:hypothetical protein
VVKSGLRIVSEPSNKLLLFFRRERKEASRAGDSNLTIDFVESYESATIAPKNPLVFVHGSPIVELQRIWRLERPAPFLGRTAPATVPDDQGVPDCDNSAPTLSVSSYRS